MTARVPNAPLARGRGSRHNSVLHANRASRSSRPTPIPTDAFAAPASFRVASGSRHVIMHNGVSRRVARRFVAGETLDDAFAAARDVNRDCQFASLDLLGENVDDEAGARRAAEGYLSTFQSHRAGKA